MATEQKHVRKYLSEFLFDEVVYDSDLDTVSDEVSLIDINNVLEDELVPFGEKHKKRKKQFQTEKTVKNRQLSTKETKVLKKKSKIVSKVKHDNQRSVTIKMKITSKVKFVLPKKKFKKSVVKHPKPIKKPKAWKYTNILENRYKGDGKRNRNHEPDVCDCPRVFPGTAGCGEDCINRMTFTECHPEYCVNGEDCKNTFIQKKKFAPVQRYMTDGKGWGVRAQKNIKEGVFVLEYNGEVLDEDIFEKKMLTKYAKDKHHYCMALGGGLVIDAHREGSECRFVNHSCDPNCEMVKWSVDGLSRMALFTTRKIMMSEEITYDYNFDNFNGYEGQICKCGAKTCRGIIGGKADMLNKICEIKMKKKHLINITKCKKLISIKSIKQVKKSKNKDDKMELTFKLWG